MMPAIQRVAESTGSLTNTSRRAFLISLAIHALLFLLLWLFGRNALDRTLSVSLLLESQPQRVEVPEEELSEVSPQARGKRRRKDLPGKTGGTRRGARENSNAPAIPQNPWSDYERDMHRRKSDSSASQAQAKAQGTAWGNEKLPKSSKQGTQESVTVPLGDSKSSTRWKKGAARRLVSLPAIEYPESIRKKSGQGQVELKVEVGADGRVEEVEILKSSGFTRLDINARNAYRNAVFSPSASGDSATGIIVVTFRVRE